MKTFQGRVVTHGCAQAEALVTHGGLNTLASFQKSLQFGDKTAKCGDQNNPDLYGKPMAGKALCLPQTIGSTTSGALLRLRHGPAASLHAVRQPHRLSGSRRGDSRRRMAPAGKNAGR